MLLLEICKGGLSVRCETETFLLILQLHYETKHSHEATRMLRIARILGINQDVGVASSRLADEQRNIWAAYEDVKVVKSSPGKTCFSVNSFEWRVTIALSRYSIQERDKRCDEWIECHIWAQEVWGCEQDATPVGFTPHSRRANQKFCLSFKETIVPFCGSRGRVTVILRLAAAKLSRLTRAEHRAIMFRIPRISSRNLTTADAKIADVSAISAWYDELPPLNRAARETWLTNESRHVDKPWQMSSVVSGLHVVVLKTIWQHEPCFLLERSAAKRTGLMGFQVNQESSSSKVEATRLQFQSILYWNL